MAVYTTIDDPTIYFNTKLYTGNGTAIASGGLAVTGVGFQPDWVWLKNRTTASRSHQVYDVIRGVTKGLKTNSGDVENTNSERLTAFGSDGFTVGNNVDVNTSGDAYASWNWKAGTSFSNSAGANGADLASDGSYNRDAGFSIVTFTGNATDDQQIYHGLNAIPKMMILKNRDNGNNESWKVYHQAIGNTHALTLDTTAATTDNVEWWSDETPTSTVFTVGRQDATNGSGNNLVVYCFAEKQGYSKFGSYIGNGSSNGSFIYTGFKPAFVMVKRTDSTANWQILDNKRNPYNPWNTALFPDTADPDTTDYSTDHLSNGFKLRVTTTSRNGSGASYIYMAFSENPFVTSSGVPACAR